MKILVVDDERDIQYLFQQRFRKEIADGQVDFHFAFSGEEALEYVDGIDEIDDLLVFTDIKMPGMGGIELLKRIKVRSHQCRVYMITAYGDDENWRAALACGADGYTTKPIDFERLKQNILES
jgi:CheY-like chemotaxis protein